MADRAMGAPWGWVATLVRCSAFAAWLRLISPTLVSGSVNTFALTGAEAGGTALAAADVAKVAAGAMASPAPMATAAVAVRKREWMNGFLTQTSLEQHRSGLTGRLTTDHSCRITPHAVKIHNNCDTAH